MALQTTSRPSSTTERNREDVQRSLAPALRFALRGAGALVVWCAFTAGMAALWEGAFDFPRGEAWALAIGLASMVAMLITLLLTVMVAMRQEEAGEPR